MFSSSPRAFKRPRRHLKLDPKPKRPFYPPRFRFFYLPVVSRYSYMVSYIHHHKTPVGVLVISQQSGVQNEEDVTKKKDAPEETRPHVNQNENPLSPVLFKDVRVLCIRMDCIVKMTLENGLCPCMIQHEEDPSSKNMR